MGRSRLGVVWAPLPHTTRHLRDGCSVYDGPGNEHASRAGCSRERERERERERRRNGWGTQYARKRILVEVVFSELRRVT